jgi:hypothetical protein
MGSLFLYRAPRLIDLGFIKVLNEIVNDGDIAIMYDIGQIIAIGIEKGRSYAAMAGAFTARVSSQVNRIRL